MKRVLFVLWIEIIYSKNKSNCSSSLVFFIVLMQNPSPCLQTGIQIIEHIQNWQHPLLTIFFKAITFLGNFEGYVIVLAIFLWSLNYRQGLLLAFIILWSASLNTALKEWWQVPRPFAYKPELAMIEVGEFSTPSGHAQGSASFWLLAFLNPQNKQKAFSRWSISFAVLFPFLIGVSRIYLGVHYPSDVLLGWLIGASISFIVLFTYQPLFSFLQKEKSQNKFIKENEQWLQLLSLLLFFLVIFFMSHANTAFLGLALGLGVGAILIENNFDASSGSWMIKVIRVLVGSVFILLTMFVLKKIFPDIDQPMYSLFRVIRYFIIGFCASWLLPQVFIKMRWT